MLAVGSINNIVAYGTVVEMKSETIHGVPLAKDCLRVSIDMATNVAALLPIPVGDELVNVGQAVGSHVAWPRELIIVQQVKVIKLSLL